MVHVLHRFAFGEHTKKTPQKTGFLRYSRVQVFLLHLKPRPSSDLGAIDFCWPAKMAEKLGAPGGQAAKNKTEPRAPKPPKPQGFEDFMSTNPRIHEILQVTYFLGRDQRNPCTTSQHLRTYLVTFNGQIPDVSKSRWWFQTQISLFSPLVGEMIQSDQYFSDGLKPPTRNRLKFAVSFRTTCWFQTIKHLYRGRYISHKPYY